MGVMIPLLGFLFPLLAIGSSDPAEVEQVHLGVDGETDSLEEALIAQEVHLGRPIRAYEDSRLDIERLAFPSFKEKGAPLQISSKRAEPGAQGNVPGNPVEILTDKVSDDGLEDTPRGGGIHHGKHR
jgi:hypothetical protein